MERLQAAVAQAARAAGRSAAEAASLDLRAAAPEADLERLEAGAGPLSMNLPAENWVHCLFHCTPSSVNLALSSL